MTERRTGRLPQAFAKAVAAELNKLMDDAGLTGQRLAELLGRSVGYVSERRNGKAAWTLDDLDVIAVELGTDGLSLLARLANPIDELAGRREAKEASAPRRNVPKVAKKTERPVGSSEFEE